MFKKKIKIVVIGNCQARPIAQILSLLNSNIEITTVAIVHLLKSEDKKDYWSFFDQADLIITQQIADNYPCTFVQTNFLKSYYLHKMITIINLYYLGYTPDLMYIRNTAKGTLKSPLGEYHNKTFLEAFRKGLTVQEAMQNYSDYEYNKRQYSGIAEQSLAELKKRELHSDISITDFMEERMFKERLFFVFNHPSKKLLFELAKRVLIARKIPIEAKFIINNYKEPLDKIIVPINVYESEKLDKDFYDRDNFKGLECHIGNNNEVLTEGFKNYTLLEIVEKFYELYDSVRVPDDC